ncbi:MULTISPECIES: TraC family protein [Brucellaceae]|uniref:TraC family protein n=1 Tax=Brucellaceae TaxID=118882 RepID=UPI00110E072B|nr:MULTISPECIES: TraC family protein [Brucellaceae]MDM8347127.1 TraC family protein [Pseudochrobactrum sp. sp1633]TMU85456.1 conjugal transfer protein TraC [Brucella haematophila]
MAKVSRVSKIQEEIARLQERLEEERSKEAERLGSIAVKAGLADLEISDRDLLKALKEVAARFQSSGTE